MTTFGADPEFVVVERATNSAVSAHTWFPPKSDPVRMGGQGLIYRDGFMVELNPAPSTCRALMINCTKRLFKVASDRLPPTHILAARSAVLVDPIVLRDAPPDVSRFGCEPARNAYAGHDVLPDLDPNHPFRYAGGHLHTGINERWIHDTASRDLFVKMVDRWAGIPLACMLGGRVEYLRRRYYGRAGEMRFQNYESRGVGIEWRVPGSNLWNHTATVSLALGIMRDIAENFEAYARQWDPRLEPLVENALNTGRGLAKLLPKRFQAKGGYSDFGYLASTILRFAKCRMFGNFALPYLAADAHSGWNEFCEMWGHPDG